MSIVRRPRDIVQSITIHNELDGEQRWVGLKLERGSWVNLSAAKTGPWARRNANPQADGDSIRGAWKAQVVDFRFRVTGEGRDPRPLTCKPTLEAVLVRHAFSRREIHVDPQQHSLNAAPCNYLYPSFCEDWVSPRSIVTVIVVHHHEVGEQSRGPRTHADLRDNGIYFYKYTYVPPTTGELWGALEEIPLPNLDDADWPLPDMSTSESFRAKLRSDFQRITKATTGSRMGHLQLFIPIHVTIDLLACSNRVRRTLTLLKVDEPEDALFDSLMDPGWDEKIHAGADVIKCKVLRSSVQLRYHIGRQILYVNFKYQRFRLLHNHGTSTWESLDQTEDEDLVHVTCMLDGIEIGKFEVGKTWPLTHIRHEVCISMGYNAPEDFKFSVKRHGCPSVKINRRSEKVIGCGTVTHPAHLIVVPC